MTKNYDVVADVKKSSIKIQDKDCWMCNRVFDTEEHKKTGHHAIPKRLKPYFNVQLPICKKCHNEINKEDEIYKKAYNMLRGSFMGIEKVLKVKAEKKLNEKKNNN